MDLRNRKQPVKGLYFDCLKIALPHRFVTDRLRATGLRAETAFACAAQFLFPLRPEVSPPPCSEV